MLRAARPSASRSNLAGWTDVAVSLIGHLLRDDPHVRAARDCGMVLLRRSHWRGARARAEVMPRIARPWRFGASAYRDRPYWRFPPRGEQYLNPNAKRGGLAVEETPRS